MLLVQLLKQISWTMGKKIHRLIISITILPVLFLLSGCETKITDLTGATGVLEGTISIGPICPVETDPPSPGCLPTAETYKAYPVGIWTSEGKRQVTQISPALDGSFSVELAPGEYLIKLEKNNGIGGSNLPAKVIITTRGKTILDIEIDTGIR
jgi:hypothetical protein